MSKQHHSPEFWQDKGVSALTDADGNLIATFAPTERRDANRDRVLSCVNACAGLEDPEKALEAARQALEMMVEFYDNVGRVRPGEGRLVRDERLEILSWRHQALALLTPKADQ